MEDGQPTELIGTHACKGCNSTLTVVGQQPGQGLRGIVSGHQLQITSRSKLIAQKLPAQTGRMVSLNKCLIFTGAVSVMTVAGGLVSR